MKLASGSVSLANIRLSLVNGTAFVDFLAAGTLTPYLNGKLTIEDSAHKKIVGYIKASGTGETLGDEIIAAADDRTFASDTGWWSKPVGVDINSTVAGKVYLSAINKSIYKTNQLTAGMLYKCLMTTTNISGTGGIRWELHDGQLTSHTTNGTFTDYGVSTGTSLALVTRTAAITVEADDVSVKPVTAPSATGATITSTRGGTTYNWASIESGFNYNDASGYGYEITKFEQKISTNKLRGINIS